MARAPKGPGVLPSVGVDLDKDGSDKDTNEAGGPVNKVGWWGFHRM